MPNLAAIFLTGLLTGGLTCLAVQGGLLAATLAQREEDRLKNDLGNKGDAFPILSFLAAKLVAYTLLGLLLGYFGSFFQLSLTTRIVLQVFVAVFMIGTAANLLNIHPIFRFFVIQPPRFLTRLIRNQTKSRDYFAPAVLGAFTVFIPCGTTQAMMALSIGTGNAFSGALIMFAFILGTSPVFFVLGYFATKLGETLHQKFMKIAAAGILLLALYNLNAAMTLSGNNFTVQAAFENVYCTVTFCSNNSSLLHNLSAINEATIELGPSGYTPNNLTLKAGSDVALHLVNRGGRGCIQAFTIPSLGIQEIVRTDTSKDIFIKTPKDPGQIRFMCSMGMYQGVFNVI